MTELTLGAATADITPSHPIELAGFAHRSGPSRGVSRKLFLRALIFQTEPGHRILLVSADLIWWGPELVSRLRHTLYERFGLPENAVLLHATHTHSGPQTARGFSPLLGEPDPAYLDRLTDTLLKTVSQALEAIEPVTVERGSGHCSIGVNRRRRDGSRIAMAPNHDGPLDPEVIVVRFKNQAGTTRAVLVHHACHPTTTDANLVSSDFPGWMSESLEDQLGEETTVLYLQGCCGDVRPALVRDGEFYRGDADDVDRLGAALTRSVTDTLERPMTVLPGARLHALSAREPLPLRCGSSTRSVDLELTSLRLARGLSLLAMNAEPVVGYGLWIKHRFGGNALPIGYSNGMIGYLPTASQVDEGGYEAEESVRYFGLPSAFDRSVEIRVKQAIGTLTTEDQS